MDSWLHFHQVLQNKDVICATDKVLDKLRSLANSSASIGPCTNVWTAGSYAVRCKVRVHDLEQICEHMLRV